MSACRYDGDPDCQHRECGTSPRVSHYCHTFNERGLGLCTLLADHGGTYHIDTVHNHSWPMS